MGYIFGNLLHTDFLKPTVVDNNINLNDIYLRALTLASIIVTFLAVVVALFKEDFRKLWENVSFTVNFHDGKKLTEVLEKESSSSQLIASKYECTLVIENSGSIAAKNCEIYIEKLCFVENGQTTHQDIQVTRQPLKWKNDNSTILIPSTANAYFSPFELLSPILQSSSPDSTTNDMVKIRMGENESPENFVNGTWMANFIIYSENAKPCRFTVDIKLNRNRWENRLAEMTMQVSVNLNK